MIKKIKSWLMKTFGVHSPSKMWHEVTMLEKAPQSKPCHERPCNGNCLLNTSGWSLYDKWEIVQKDCNGTPEEVCAINKNVRESKYELL
jgi:hypothetical protein